MKKFTVLLVVLGSMLAGCVAYEVDVPVAANRPYYYDRGDGVPARTYRDRDRDGMPDRGDARPNNPQRY